ncbi:MAG: hypothetical protein A2231_01145 [Candidatus Firestonebacteria bacterium RIFOXYA2_FULL_40_8]|nr:MAG: hypothetical protein A2231_01145 [Candidatus Firestonebacteria bacterium RIFOXYA2_FULL_40_8]
MIRKSRDETEIIRKGVLEITVIDKEGRLIKNAVVKVDQSKHEFWFGTSVSTFRLSKHDKAVRDRYLGLLKDNFNSAVHENALKWHSTEKEEGKISYKDVDTILSWCEENNISMRGHCIFWEVEKVVQPWVKNLGREELKQAIIRRATGLTERYRGRISEYDVNNEMMHGSFYKDRLGEEIWKVMFDTAKKGDPDAVLYVNDYDIMTNGFMEEEYVKHIRHLTDMGASVGGIGIQGHFNTAVDAFQVERALNILSKLNLPIKITEFDIDVEDEQVKAEGLEVLYRICFAHPEVKGILMWGFWEGAHWRPRAALFKKDFSPTLSAKMYRKLVFDEWWTKAAGKTDQNGKYSCRAFYGDHQITVTLPDGKTIVREVTMSSKEKNKNLRFTIDN